MRLAKIKVLAMRGLVDPALGTVPVQARLLCEDIMFYTPPRNQKQGKDRVERDFVKIFNPIDFATIKDASLQKIVYSGNVIAWEKFASNERAGGFYRKDAVTPTQELHNAWRDKRGRGRQTRFVTLRPQQRQYKTVLKESISHIGWAKSGWLTGYLALGGTRAPAWVTRHGSQNGSYVDGLAAENPYIEINNNTGWGRYKEEGTRIINDALTRRARSMRSFYETTMRLAAQGEPTSWQTQQAALVASE